MLNSLHLSSAFPVIKAPHISHHSHTHIHILCVVVQDGEQLGVILSLFDHMGGQGLSHRPSSHNPNNGAKLTTEEAATKKSMFSFGPCLNLKGVFYICC